MCLTTNLKYITTQTFLTKNRRECDRIPPVTSSLYIQTCFCLLLFNLHVLETLVRSTLKYVVVSILTSVVSTPLSKNIFKNILSESKMKTKKYCQCRPLSSNTTLLITPHIILLLDNSLQTEVIIFRS